ncbi:hypothetical protein HCA61_03210 [Rhodococcus sp. HNM0563]|uniref:hypothetical protein n=1 Tax=unclassified Rhodococcus (in: high G+C Gram-positive bacteria) TaxID=192944 RepID=UPI00146CC2C2|nr:MULTISPECIES: hypothetical protein [unclassified Rhodococcus (in: high G+C Gram-positive bacteria)]MCK0092830.1 hypothetical protein [Rhodococcus sp. F64268]NLU61271.1 hypothetical protein [Rhodococcus sp. HNM0563]
MTAPAKPAAKATETAAKAATDATATAQKTAEKLTASAAAAADKAAAELTKTVDETTERVNEFNAKFVEAAKQSGNLGVDTYEKAVGSILDMQEKFAEATPVEWVADIAKAQVSFARELTSTVTTTARDLLK